MQNFVLDTTTSFIIGVLVGWHFLPQPVWVQNLINWYHGVTAHKVVVAAAPAVPVALVPAPVVLTEAKPAPVTLAV